MIKAFEEEHVEESAVGNPVRVLLKSVSLGGELCKLGLWRCAAAGAHCVQQETKPNKFHLVLQNFGARAPAAAALDLRP